MTGSLTVKLNNLCFLMKLDFWGFFLIKKKRPKTETK